ncbi:GspH/FimT family pseudopilin [Pseudomonas sp. RIT-PI-S]|uniref:GspH/FimT family pseudopilin n=1 Tax=Pseudomonas sp. RIT-PI-S TaxID=3035295 RepID=UPI0021DA00CF|nr:GspH/FimT family pseudopilin [Pseudomonas sp. RIT-PI-S]
MPPSIKPALGLTLLDLLIVVAVLAVLANLAVPAFSALITEQRRLAFANELASGLRSARFEAVQRNRIVILQPLGGQWANGWRMVVDESGQGPADPRNPVILNRAGPWPISVVPSQNLSEQIAFDHLGVPRLPNRGALAGTFHLCEADRSDHRRVVIARTGRVRVTRDGAPTALCPLSSGS